VSNLQEILRKYWGHPDFKHPQKEIIESILERKDTIAVLPTGGGKSLCYQIPALITEGITLVISPLIALMQDQVQNMNKIRIGAASITSQLNSDEIAAVIAKCQSGNVKLLYIAPERLLSRNFIQILRTLKVSLIAVDEAHCIAEWGHDFRPAYMKISHVKKLFPNVTLLALTATATLSVQKEIAAALEMKDPVIFKSSLKRKNLIYKVLNSQDEKEDLIYELKKNPGSAIIFTRTRKQTFEIFQFLSEKGFEADYFHSKLPPEEKKFKQENWTKSACQIMVSTNAFGMGIDKPDVKNVIHLYLPSGIEAYVQEAGRAGRNGEDSQAILFLKPNAAGESEKIFKSSLPDKNDFEYIIKMFYNQFEIGENERPEDKLEFDLNQFLTKFNLNKKKTVKTLEFLERKECVLFIPSSGLSKIKIVVNPEFIQNTKSVYFQILEYLVRNHPGILSEEKPVSEFYIARALHKPIKKIKKILKKMSESGYLCYKSQNVQNVEFLRPRESNFIKGILWNDFETLQKIKWKRLQDLIYYATQKEICRERLILRYFGEKSTENCGYCDVCKKEKQYLNAESILEFLEESPKSIREILLYFINSPKESVLETMQELADEGLIENVGIDSFKKSERK